MSEAETLEVPSPAASGIVADGAVQEEAWSPSFTEQLLAETHEVLRCLLQPLLGLWMTGEE